MLLSACTFYFTQWATAAPHALLSPHEGESFSAVLPLGLGQQPLANARPDQICKSPIHTMSGKADHPVGSYKYSFPSQGPTG